MEKHEYCAFPNPGTKFGGGLSYKEYFMAHAPMEIPDWFICDLSELGNRPKPISNGLPSWEEETTNQIEIDSWDRRVKIERYFQWRQFYAIKMCQL